jgi:hypothetical protein
MATETLKREYITGWNLGWRWRMEHLEVGQEYIVWPNDRTMKQKRGRRCVLLRFVSGYYGIGIDAEIHYVDNEEVDTVRLADLIPTCFVGKRPQDDASLAVLPRFPRD